MVWVLILLVLLVFGLVLYQKGRLKVHEGFVGWDGETVYQAGEIWTLNQVQMIDVSERFATFGLDQLGVISAVNTNRSENINDRIRGGILGSDSERNTRKDFSETIFTRERENIRHRFVIVWKPNPENLRTYLKQGNIDERLAELLRTLPDADLKSYQDLLGITIVRTDGAKPKKVEGLTIGEGIEIPDNVRDRHVYILGRPGMGKSTLLRNMARQDIESGKGVGVIDPHGDLIEDLLKHIPRDRVDDAILFNAADLPIGLNFFNAQTDSEKELITDDVVVLFKRLSDSWGDRMDVVLRSAVRSLAEVPDATFLDIYRILTDPNFREHVVSHLTLQPLIDFWLQVYPKFPHPVTEQPILSRMGKFAISRTLSTITGTTSPLNIAEVIRDKKILLCSIPKSTIGPDISAILGALLVSQFQLAALRRGSLPPKKRTPFYLYIDEFQTFQTSAFNEIITEARKYQLCLTLANQKLADLDDLTRGAVQGVETSIYFSLFPDDVPRAAKALGADYDVRNLLNLDKWEAIMKPGRSSQAMRFDVSEPPKAGRGYDQEIRENTKKNYPSTFPPRDYGKGRGKRPDGGPKPSDPRPDDEPKPGDPLPDD
jgi:hypothetical protein